MESSRSSVPFTPQSKHGLMVAFSSATVIIVGDMVVIVAIWGHRKDRASPIW
jgi:hypothetical protein